MTAIVGRAIPPQRKRVIDAMSLREPDRVPVGLWGTVEGYQNLRKGLGMAPTGRTKTRFARTALAGSAIANEEAAVLVVVRMERQPEHATLVEPRMDRHNLTGQIQKRRR